MKKKDDDKNETLLHFNTGPIVHLSHLPLLLFSSLSSSPLLSSISHMSTLAVALNFGLLQEHQHF